VTDDGLPPDVAGSPKPDKERIPATGSSSSTPWIVGGVVAVLLVAGLVAVVSGSGDQEVDGATPMELTPVDPEESAQPPDGVEQIDVTTRSHVEGDVEYESVPGVGGDHADVWVNCGFYPEPQSEEQAVHSLEHGAVWIAYRPGLPEEQMSELQALAAQPFTLVTPVEGLPADVVASAWGARLELDGVDDPSLLEFLEFFRQGPQTPEPGAPCTSGVGTPA
jgi:hypothetical protein